MCKSQFNEKSSIVCNHASASTHTEKHRHAYHTCLNNTADRFCKQMQVHNKVYRIEEKKPYSTKLSNKDSYFPSDGNQWRIEPQKKRPSKVCPEL